MSRLELPINIRTAHEDELPRTDEYQQLIQSAKDAEIVEGYKFFLSEDKHSNYKFYSEINVNNSKLWSLFISLTSSMPNPVSVIYGHKDDEVSYGSYIEKNIILESISKFKTELVEDGYIQFGLLSHTKDILVEVFIDCSKYVKYWGVDQDFFLNTMTEYDLKENDNLKFIDEFPLVTEALSLYKPNVKDPEEVIEYFNKSFVK